MYKNSETDLQNWFDNLSKCIESLEKGSGNTCQQKLVLFNSIKEDYINNGEKLINNLRSNCQDLREVVSISDAQLLDDQVFMLYFIFLYFLQQVNYDFDHVNYFIYIVFIFITITTFKKYI